MVTRRRKPREYEYSELEWGSKHFNGSSFQLFVNRYIDSYIINDHPEGETKGYLRFLGVILKMAILDAEEEVRQDPDSLGPHQADILSIPKGTVEIRTVADDGSEDYANGRKDWGLKEVPAEDIIGMCCVNIGLDPEFFRTKVADYLDKIADDVRQQQLIGGNVVRFEKPAKRKPKQPKINPIEVVCRPVLSRKRLVGEQFGWSF